MLRLLIEVGPVVFLVMSLTAKCTRATLALTNSAALSVSTRSAIVSSAVLAAVPLPLMGPSDRIGCAMLVNVLVTTLLLADRIHVDFFRDVMSVAELRDAWQLISVWSSVRTKLHRRNFLPYLDIVAVALVVAAGAYVDQPPHSSLAVRAGWTVALVVFAIVLGLPSALAVYGRHAGPFESRALQSDIVRLLGILYYHVYDAISHGVELFRGNRVARTEREHVRKFLEQRRRTRRKAALFGVANGCNVIMVQAEAVQGFLVDMHVRGRPVTPNLNAFAAESLRFPNCYEQTHGGSTSDAIFVALQSLHPLAVGAIATRHLQNQYFALPAILSRYGYRTLAAMGASGEPWKIGKLFTRLGFDRSYLDDFYQGERFGQGLADRDFFAQTARVLAGQANPFMAFLVSVSNHHPFELPGHHQEFDVGELDGTILGNYCQSAHYFDTAFGEFLTYLRTAGLLDNSVLVVYGDHEAWLDDPPELGPLVGLAGNDPYGYWSLRKRVPLLVRVPHGNYAGVIDRAGGQLDIAPTILGLLGVGTDAVAMLGHDLLDGTRSLVVVRDGSCTDGRYTCVAGRSTRAGWTVSNLSPSDPNPGTASLRCFDAGAEVNRESLTAMYEAGVQELHVSDLILKGDLVRELTSPQLLMEPTSGAPPAGAGRS